MGIRNAVFRLVDALRRRQEDEPVTPVEEDEAEESLEEQPVEYSGFVIVRLVGGKGLPGGNSLHEEAWRRGFERLVDLLEGFGVEGTRLIQGVSPEEVWAFEHPDAPFPEGHENDTWADERRESEDWHQPGDEEEQPAEEEPDQTQEWPAGPASLNLYWRIDMRESGTSPEELVRELQRLGPEGGVGRAYQEVQVSLAQINPANEPDFPSQGYLHPRPSGINAQAAWARFGPGQQISNVGFGDVEEGWFRQHPDLPTWLQGLPLRYGQQCGNATELNHGISVLGIMMAIDNSLGIIGLSAGLPQNRLRLISPFDAANNNNNNVADAITTTITTGGLVAGDVLLIEVQRSGRPVEVTDCGDFAAIYHAVHTHGIIVIEAAGNGKVNLDPVYAALDCTEDGLPGVKDSGAIIVGGCRPVRENDGGIEGHRRYTHSSYGARVDCHAWGDGVKTTRMPGDSTSFGGTSAAAAIIAGGVILIQSLHKTNNNGQPLAPATLRDALRDENNGTPQVKTNNRPIGPMPDLGLVLQALQI